MFLSSGNYDNFHHDFDLDTGNKVDDFALIPSKKSKFKTYVVICGKNIKPTYSYNHIKKGQKELDKMIERNYIQLYKDKNSNFPFNKVVYVNILYTKDPNELDIYINYKCEKYEPEE